MKLSTKRTKELLALLKSLGWECDELHRAPIKTVVTSLKNGCYIHEDGTFEPFEYLNSRDLKPMSFGRTDDITMIPFFVCPYFLQEGN